MFPDIAVVTVVEMTMTLSPYNIVAVAALVMERTGKTFFKHNLI